MNFEQELDPFTNAEKLLEEWTVYLEQSLLAVEVAKKEIKHWQEVVDGERT